MPLSESAQKLGMKDFDTMVQMALKILVDANVGITNTSPGSVVRTIVETLIQNDASSNYFIERVYNALNIDTAMGTDLDALVAILGVSRNPATYATGKVTMTTGLEPAKYDIHIPYHTLITTRKDNNGKIYEYIVSDDNAVLTAGSNSIELNVIAVNPGHQYVPAGGLTVLTSSIEGIQSVYNDDAIDSGRDAETDKELRYRAKNISKSYGKCTETALKLAVQEVSDVIGCDIVDMPNGKIGTIDVNVATEIIPPPQSTQDKVREIVLATKAAGVYANIKYPTVFNKNGISVEIQILNNDGTQCTSITDDTPILQAINDYELTLGIGEPFVISQMERYILNALGDEELDINTITPKGNIIPGGMEIIKVKDVTINGVKHDA